MIVVVFTTFQDIEVNFPLSQTHVTHVLRIGMAFRAQDDLRPLVFHIDGSAEPAGDGSDGRVSPAVSHSSTEATLSYSEPVSPAPTLQYSLPGSPERSPSRRPSTETVSIPSASDDVSGDMPSTLIGRWATV